jgi:hypothetical protein
MHLIPFAETQQPMQMHGISTLTLMGLSVAIIAKAF